MLQAMKISSSAFQMPESPSSAPGAPAAGESLQGDREKRLGTLDDRKQTDLPSPRLTGRHRAVRRSSWFGASGLAAGALLVVLGSGVTLPFALVALVASLWHFRHAVTFARVSRPGLGALAGTLRLRPPAQSEFRKSFGLPSDFFPSDVRISVPATRKPADGEPVARG
jgi:hypothetical protein